MQVLRRRFRSLRRGRSYPNHHLLSTLPTRSIDSHGGSTLCYLIRKGRLIDSLIDCWKRGGREGDTHTHNGGRLPDQHGQRLGAASLLPTTCPGLLHPRYASCPHTKAISYSLLTEWRTGWSIKSYATGDPIPLFVNKLTSPSTPLAYAYSTLPFVCPSPHRRLPGTNLITGTPLALNLGEVLRGDRIAVSDYELEMGKDDVAHYLCSTNIDASAVKRAQEIVRSGYEAEWIVDNLPGATSFVTMDRSRKYYASGFKMGYAEMDAVTGVERYYLNNHVTIVIRFHKAPGSDGEKGRKVIVGFEVYAKSIEAGNRDANGLPVDLHSTRPGLELTVSRNATTNSTMAATSLNMAPEPATESTLTIPYSYSVYFREEPHIEWSHRWDLYFVNAAEDNDTMKFHWLALVNSLVIFAALTVVVGVVLARTLYSDIKGSIISSKSDPETGKRSRSSPRKNYSSEKLSGSGMLSQGSSDALSSLDTDFEDDDFMSEDVTGWKLLHADVFRPPPYAHILAPLIGSGVQLLLTSAGLLGLSVCGYLNPSYRGGFATTGVLLYLLSAPVSGFVSARVFKSFHGLDWRRHALVTATLVPGSLFALTLVLDLLVWTQGSSSALPFTTLLGLALLHVGVQVPLVYCGTWAGYMTSSAIVVPTSGMPRPVPAIAGLPWWQRPINMIVLAGGLPFAVVFVEMVFAFRGLWESGTSGGASAGSYSFVGFAGVVGVVLVGVVAEVAVVGVWALLCSEVHPYPPPPCTFSRDC